MRVELKSHTQPHDGLVVHDVSVNVDKDTMPRPTDLWGSHVGSAEAEKTMPSRILHVKKREAKDENLVQACSVGVEAPKGVVSTVPTVLVSKL